MSFLTMRGRFDYPTVQEYVAVVRAIRKATGQDMNIMVDYNQCHTPSEAVERMRVLDDEGLTWVEELTLAHDYARHARVAREARTPVQCGQNWWGTLDLRHAIEASAWDGSGQRCYRFRRRMERRRGATVFGLMERF